MGNKKSSTHNRLKAPEQLQRKSSLDLELTLLLKYTMKYPNDLNLLFDDYYDPSSYSLSQLLTQHHPDIFPRPELYFGQV